MVEPIYVGGGRAAYGLIFEGVDTPVLQRAPERAWPRITLEMRSRPTLSPPPAMGVTEDRAEIPVIGGSLVLDRRRRTAVVSADEPLSPDAVAHPYLAPVASVFSHWFGRAPFHGGAILVAGRAWAVVGPQEAGKTSLLAEMGRRGVEVVTDDLVVVDGTTVFAGPRSLDLRTEAAKHFGGGRDLGIVGKRERWRVDLGPVPHEVPLGGWILPRWGTRSAVEPASARDRLVALAANRAVRLEPASPTQLLDLARMPGLRLVTERRWGALEQVAGTLLDAISDL